MAIHPLAGKPAPADILIDVAALEKAYYERKPNVDDPAQLVSFGTSGHRGSPLSASLNEAHILAITQAICEYRASKQITGPLFMGKDTHADIRAGAADGARSAGGKFSSKRSFRRTTASRRRRRSHGRYWRITAARKTASPTALSSRRRIIHRPTAASNTIRRMAGRRIPMSPIGYKGGQMTCCATVIAR